MGGEDPRVKCSTMLFSVLQTMGLRYVIIIWDKLHISLMHVCNQAGASSLMIYKLKHCKHLAPWKHNYCLMTTSMPIHELFNIRK